MVIFLLYERTAPGLAHAAAGRFPEVSFRAGTFSPEEGPDDNVVGH